LCLSKYFLKISILARGLQYSFKRGCSDNLGKREKEYLIIAAMKKMFFILIFAMVTAFSTKAQPYGNNNNSISMQTFYDELSPYGEWINSNDYGYVWTLYRV
jgi:hypothetical protein